MNSFLRSLFHHPTLATAMLIVLSGGIARGQTVLHCGDSFTDSGGPGGNYSNGENITYQICPDNPGDAVRVIFTEFRVENGFDRLACFNGPSVNSPAKGSFTGDLNNNLPGGTAGIVSTDLSGCLTFRFNSDGSSVSTGWNASISCAPQCMPPTNLTASNIGVHSVQLNWAAPVNGLPAAGYEYEVRTSGAAGSGANGLITENSLPGSPNQLLITGLNGNSTYSLYMRSRCGSTDSSLWTSGVQVLTKPGCSSSFNDPGGVNGNYGLNLDTTWVICPDQSGDAIQVTFSQFGLYPDDTLSVYNGNSISAALIGKFTGTGLLKAPGAGEVTANNPEGCLTFRLKSNANNVSTGWLASIQCLNGPVNCLAPTALFASNLTDKTAVIGWKNPAFTSPGAYDYQIRTQGVPGDSLGLALSGSVNAPDTSALITGLVGNTSYTLFLRSNCGSNQSNWTIVPYRFMTLPGCGSSFTDSGGPEGNYSNSENITYQLCPENPGDAVRVIFSSFRVENGFDRLYCFNGPNSNSPSLGSFTGDLNNSLPGGTAGIVSTDLSGCLTFRFNSDGSSTTTGWTASISCSPQCMPPTNLTVSEIGVHSAQLNWNAPVNGLPAAGYEYELRTSGAAGSGANGLISGDTLPVSPSQTSIANLAGNTAYSVYVRSRCDTSAQSLWTPAVSFITNPGCGSSFNDLGGISGNYGLNTDTSWVICPDNANEAVSISFSQFSILPGDTLFVYDSDSMNAGFIGGFSGSGLLKAPGAGALTASNENGCLTFRFKSNASLVDLGWIAGIECLKAPINCVSPSGFSASDITSSSARIHWQAPSFTNPVSYAYEVRTEGLPGTGAEGLAAIGVIEASQTQALISSLSGNTSYKLYMRSICDDENSPWSVVPFVFMTQPGCGSSFTDSGGPNAAYKNGENTIYKLCPESPGDSVRVIFSSFVVESGFDRLYCYNGPGTASPLLGNFTGNLNNNPPGGAQGLVSTDPSGCLTFRFSSDGSNALAGWDAQIICRRVCTPSVFIQTASGGTFCEGKDAVFTALPFNGGSDPVYQWMKNGEPVGADTSIFTSATLQNNDLITLVMTSNESCASPDTAASNSITVQLKAAQVPSASLVASPGTEICLGETLQFNLSTNVSGGSIQWLRNSQPVGTNEPVYSASDWSDNDQISALVRVAELGCYTADSVFSASLEVQVNEYTPLGNVSISGSAAGGEGGTFTASYQASLPVGLGSYALAWYVNGVLAETIQNEPSWERQTSSTDTVFAILYAQSGCFNPDSSISNKVEVTDPTGIAGNEYMPALRVYPNPFTSTLFMDGLRNGDFIRITDASGRTVQLSRCRMESGQVFALHTESLARGMYFLQIIGHKGQSKVLKIQKQ